MLKNSKLTKKEFEEKRLEVLQTWPTGKDVSLKDGFSYQKQIHENKNFAFKIKEARDNKKILLQPRAGVALVEEHVKLLKYLENEGFADLLPTTIDAYTRQNKYEEAAKGIEKSITAGTSLLNGFPAVNYGLEGCKKVFESVEKPIQVRHGTPDARLLAEITIASGFTSFEGGGISYNIPYTKKIPLETSIECWQYVDRLVGLYQEEGITINREPFGPLTGTLIPPCISNSIGIIEGLLALEQGVTSISLGYGQGGNLIQDMAAIITLREVAEEYFVNAGFNDFELTTVFHQWMGGFPEDEARAFSVICWGTVVAHFAQVNKLIVKSPHEAFGIPTMEANAQGLRATRQALNMLEGQFLSGGAILAREIEILKKEIKCILDKVFELGEGDLVIGTIAAFESGVLDVPFAPSIYNKGKILPIRDNEGFIRLLKNGNIPLTNDIMDFHNEQISLRAKEEERDISIQMVTDDIYAISKGKLIGRPK